jgi:branched-chain amino acid transport system permease protein
VGLGAYGVLQLSNWARAAVSRHLARRAGVRGDRAADLVRGVPAARRRLRVGTWAIAEVWHLLTIQDGLLGAGSGSALTMLSGIDPILRDALTYWSALGVTLCYVLGIPAAARPDRARAHGDPGGRDRGRQQRRAHRTGQAQGLPGRGGRVRGSGGLVIVSQFDVAPDSAYSVRWSAYMIFMVLLDGIGTLEGAIIGAALFTIVQQYFATDGAWYLIVLGAVCAPATIWIPRGLRGLVERTPASGCCRSCAACRAPRDYS